MESVKNITFKKLEFSDLLDYQRLFRQNGVNNGFSLIS